MILFVLREKIGGVNKLLQGCNELLYRQSSRIQKKND